MKITTPKFEKDIKQMVLEQNSHRNCKPYMRRKMVELVSVMSSIKQKYIDELNEYIGFYTKLSLYKGRKNYFLQVSGVSTAPKVFPSKNKIITFEDPDEFGRIVFDEGDKRVFWSPLTEEMVDKIHYSEYITDFEKERWELFTIEDGE